MSRITGNIGSDREYLRGFVKTYTVGTEGGFNPYCIPLDHYLLESIDHVSPFYSYVEFSRRSNKG